MILRRRINRQLAEFESGLQNLFPENVWPWHVPIKEYVEMYRGSLVQQYWANILLCFGTILAVGMFYFYSEVTEPMRNVLWFILGGLLYNGLVLKEFHPQISITGISSEMKELGRL